MQKVPTDDFGLFMHEFGNHEAGLNSRSSSCKNSAIEITHEITLHSFRPRMPKFQRPQLLLLVSYIFVPAFVPMTAADVSDWPVW
eukprot:4033959-Prymnesium_polylepis.3